MKKIFVSIIAIIYMGVSSGIAMDIHYCMGKKAGTDFYSGANEKCSKCGMKNKTSGCCNDEHKFYKLSDSHKTVSNDLSFETPIAIVGNIFPSYTCQIIQSSSKVTTLSNSPPQYSGPAAFILNCTFRL